MAQQLDEKLATWRTRPLEIAITSCSSPQKRARTSRRSGNCLQGSQGPGFEPWQRGAGRSLKAGGGSLQSVAAE